MKKTFLIISLLFGITLTQNILTSVNTALSSSFFKQTTFLLQTYMTSIPVIIIFKILHKKTTLLKKLQEINQHLLEHNQTLDTSLKSLDDFKTPELEESMKEKNNIMQRFNQTLALMPTPQQHNQSSQ